MSGKNKSENILKKDMEQELTIEDMGVMEKALERQKE